MTIKRVGYRDLPNSYVKHYNIELGINGDDDEIQYIELFGIEHGCVVTDWSAYEESAGDYEI